MDASTIRIKKEVRALLRPWCVVMLAGASPLVESHRYAEPLSFLSFFFGVPLLATLSLGNEFYHRTLTLWLAQPLNRMRTWAEKMIVMLAAVSSAGLVSGVVMFTVTWPNMRFPYKVAAIVYVVVSAAAATYLSLTTRSTIGGLLLIASMLWVGTLFSEGTDKPSHPGAETTALIFLFSFGLCFGGLMLWLGVRTLARFQVTGSADSDLLVAGPALAPEALADLFRCRPSGALLNLIRKELRLLRPVWLIGFLVIFYTAGLAIFRILPAPPAAEPRHVLEWVLLGPLVSICVAMAGLAGILSLGEERTSGTQAWHMTLPISARRQWLIKLLVGMLAGLCCSLVFPVLAMIAGGVVYGSPLMFVNVGTLPDLVIVFSILTFSCFWCACAGNGTVNAAVWAVPVTAIVALTCGGGLWLGEELAQAKGTLKDFLVSSLHLSPFVFATIFDFARQHILWLFAPTLLFALLQSYQLFRKPSRDSVGWKLRCLLPLVAVTALWSFASAAAFGYSTWEPFLETRKALDRFQRTNAKIELSGDDLAQTNALSLPTRRWLTGSHIEIIPDSSLSRVYYATIRLASGTECKLTVVQYAGLAATCGRRRP